MTETETGAYQQAFEHAQKLLETGQAELALQQVDAILEVHPRDVKTNFLKGSALRQLGQFEEAIALLGQLARATTGVGVIHQELGYALHAVGRMEDAVVSLREAVNINPKLAGSWKLLGESLLSEGEAEEATEAIRRGVSNYRQVSD